MIEAQDQEHGSLFKNVSVVSLFSGIRIAASLVVYILIASFVGVSVQADGYFIAFTIPGLVNTVLYSSRYALISSFSKSKGGDRDGFHRLPSTILSVTLFTASLIAIISFFGASVLVILMAPGASAETHEIAAELLRILAWIPLFASLNTVLGALLNAANHFTIVAISETFLFITAIVAGIVFQEFGIISICWGLLVGTGVQFLVLAIASYAQIGFRYTPTLDLTNRTVIDTLKLSWVSIQGMLLRYGTPLSDRLFASFLPAGSIALIQYGARFVAPTSLIFYDSIVAVSMPTLSTSLNQDRNIETDSLLKSNWRLIRLISLPVTAVIIGLNYPLVTIVFQRGAFGQAAVEQVVPLSLVYNFSLLFSGYLKLQQSYLYTIADKRRIIQLIGLITVSDILIKGTLLFLVGPMAAAIAFTVSNGITAVVGSQIVAKLQGLKLKDLFPSDFGLIAVATTSGLSAYLVSNLIIERVTASELLSNLMGILGGGLVSVLILASYFLLYRREEVRNLSYTLR